MVEAITEQELQDILNMRQQKTQLAALFKQIEAQLSGAESVALHKLKAGVPVVGNLQVVIEEVFGQCRPAWKDVHLSHMADVHGLDLKKAESAVKAATQVPVKEQLVIAPKE